MSGAIAEFEVDASEDDVLSAWKSAGGDSEEGGDSETPAGDEVAPPVKTKATVTPDPDESDEEEADDEEADEEDDSEDDEEDDEEEAVPEGELDEWAKDLAPEIQEKIRAKNAAARMRIDQLKGQREAARVARTAAEQERDTIRERANAVLRQPIPLARAESDPLSDIGTLDALDAEVAQARQMIAWAIDHADGADEIPDGKGGTLSYSPQQIARMKAQAEAVLTLHAPARREYLKAHNAHAAEARKNFPALYRDGSPEKQFALSILARVPELAKSPDYELLLGYMARGHQLALDEASGVQYVRLKPKADRPVAKQSPEAKEKQKPKAPAPLSAGARPQALAPGQKPDPSAPMRQALAKAATDEDVSDALTRSLEAKFG
jgi:hypothetical protein